MDVLEGGCRTVRAHLLFPSLVLVAKGEESAQVPRLSHALDAPQLLFLVPLPKSTELNVICYVPLLALKEGALMLAHFIY